MTTLETLKLSPGALLENPRYKDPYVVVSVDGSRIQVASVLLGNSRWDYIANNEFFAGAKRIA